MKMTVKEILMIVCVSVSIVNVIRVKAQKCEYPPCSTVPNRLIFFYPNWEDCSTYWRCFNDVATMMTCPRGQVFDFFTFKCKTRPTRTTLQVNPVFSCEILLKGLQALDLPHS